VAHPGKKRFTTKSDPEHVRARTREPELHGPRPDALWVADFTYCSTWSGVVCVAFIIDVYSRRLVGWKAARSMNTASSSMPQHGRLDRRHTSECDH